MKIKSLIICALSIASLKTSFAQTGPGGVGNSTTNIGWFDASSNVFSDAGITNATNNSSVQQWTDISGNNRTITQTSASNKPTYKTNLINGFAGISFDGINDFIEGSLGGSTLTRTSVFWIGNFTNASQPNGDYDYVYSIGSAYNTNVSFARLAQNHTGGNGNKYYGYIMNQVLIGTSTLLDNSNHIYTQRINNTSSFHHMSQDGSTQTVQQPSTSASFSANIRLGALKNSSPSHPLNGNISELIVYNSFLNTTQSIIVENYLSAKYALALTANDKYSFDATHGNEVAGIGQTSATDNHTSAQGTSIVLVENALNLDDGEFAMWGHDNAGTGSNGNDFNSDTIQLNQEWRWDETGGFIGAANITFDMTGIGLGLDASKYILVSSSTGDFSNATVVGTPNVNGSLITFTGVDLNDGDFFTIAYDGVVTLLSSSYFGSGWSTVEQWDLSTTPDSTYNVLIKNADTVDVTAYATVNDLTLEDNATLTIGNNVTLKIFGDLIVGDNANFICGTNAQVIFASPTGAQTITKNGSGNLDFFDLTIDNASGVSLAAGNIDLTNVLNLSSGNFTLSDTLTFISDASRTAHIETANGNITGTITVQRFASARQSGWNDIASPVVGTTISDIDNELYISGVTGGDGYAGATGGGSFVSIYTMNNVTQAFVPVSNVTDPMTNGIGFEIWLADDINGWTAKAWDMTGTIDLENATQQTLSIETGWNFLGNPYPAFLDFTALDAAAGNISDHNFWTLEPQLETNGVYIPKSFGESIPPGQGFWLLCTNGNDIVLDPSTMFFTGTSTSNLYKNDYVSNSELRILLKSKDAANNFGSNTFLRKNDYSFAGQDALDMPALRISDPKSCLISFDNSGTKNLVNYVNTSENHLELPLTVESGLSGEFEVSFDGIDQFNEYQCINLVNNETGERIPLTEKSVIDLKVKENTPVNMTLVLSKEDYADCLAPKMYTSGDVAISSYGKVIFTDFKLDRGTTAHISVLDILGNTVLTADKNVGFNRELFDLSNATAGVYLVSITINGETQTEKVILQ